VFEALLESGCGNGRGSSTVGDDVASSGSDGRNLQRNDRISYVLNPKQIAHLGSGRPLGSHYDGEGNLIVCDSLKVSEGRVRGRGMSRERVRGGCAPGQRAAAGVTL
jgi:hypothetical protein